MEGRCPKCGARYLGEALRMCQNQMCGYCGCGLEIRDEQGKTFTGYSPFKAAEYTINAQKKIPSSPPLKE